MDVQGTQPQRLDYAAKAFGREAYLRASRAALTILAALGIVLGLCADGHSVEIMAVRAVAVLIAAATLLSWSSSRYSSFGFPLAILTYGILTVVLRYYTEPPEDRIGELIFLPFVAYWAYSGFVYAFAYLTVEGAGWDNERARIKAWIHQLKIPDGLVPIFEFSSGTFWNGYFTYRLLKADNYWVVAKFKTGKLHRMLECRFLDSSSVQIVEDASGELRIEVDGRPIPRVRTSHDMRTNLLRAVADA